MWFGFPAYTVCIAAAAVLSLGLFVITARKAGFPTVGVYDKYSYRQDILRENSTIYISEKEDVSSLIPKLQKRH